MAGVLGGLEWLLESMRGKFVLSEPEILPRDDQPEDEAIPCLKKRRYLPQEL